ncbi:60S acidic ribosomal protein P0 [Myotis davidii]|uniref:Large ribosomal subunit protein uL10 n=1 Tax=Myotis davidii TaxID=225400 RepID=L5LSM2_MYODS|nr:60S acidic ribosomal protein P0 [Myotis davidii]
MWSFRDEQVLDNEAQKPGGATWKSNYFLRSSTFRMIIPKASLWSRQCGLQAGAADLHVPLREGCGADGQEHHDAQGHPRTPGKQPGSGETAAHIRGNVGFVFTKEDLTEIRDLLLANKVPAAARAGAIAQCEVTVPAQNIGLGP